MRLILKALDNRWLIDYFVGLLLGVLLFFSILCLCRYTIYQTMVSFFLPLPLILLCYILILCYTWRMYRRNKKARQ